MIGDAIQRRRQLRWCEHVNKDDTDWVNDCAKWLTDLSFVVSTKNAGLNYVLLCAVPSFRQVCSLFIASVHSAV